MSTEKFIQAYVRLVDSNKKEVDGEIVVRDEMAMSVFSDPKLAFNLYTIDKRAGEDVYYNDEYNAYVQVFKGLKKEVIMEKLKREIIQVGGRIL